MKSESLTKELMENPGVSNWLKNALRTALARDCVDAANDAEILVKVLAMRCDEVFAINQ